MKKLKLFRRMKKLALLLFLVFSAGIGFSKTLMGRRKYLSLSRFHQPKYQQLWIRIGNNVKAHIPIEFHDLSPADVSFLEKKTLRYKYFL